MKLLPLFLALLSPCAFAQSDADALANETLTRTTRDFISRIPRSYLDDPIPHHSCAGFDPRNEGRTYRIRELVEHRSIACYARLHSCEVESGDGALFVIDKVYSGPFAFGQVRCH